ncbi:MAG: hypothetical protein IPL40_14745 [Proteobacteria bacterium]|nr:hypothetical protein [Pseudomonadota bacterium]
MINKVVLFKLGHTYYYDPAARDWDKIAPRTEVPGSSYSTDTLVAVPGGMILSGYRALWQLDHASQTFKERRVKGVSSSHRASGADRQVAGYNRKRDRLLMFASQWQKGQVWACVHPPEELHQGIYDVSLGLVRDDQSRIWAINTLSRICLLKLDPAQADKLELQ